MKKEKPISNSNKTFKTEFKKLIITLIIIIIAITIIKPLIPYIHKTINDISNSETEIINKLFY